MAFHERTRAMQAYPQVIGVNTTLMLSTVNDVFRLLKGMKANGFPAIEDGGNQ